MTPEQKELESKALKDALAKKTITLNEYMDLIYALYH